MSAVLGEDLEGQVFLDDQFGDVLSHVELLYFELGAKAIFDVRGVAEKVSEKQEFRFLVGQLVRLGLPNVEMVVDDLRNEPYAHVRSSVS
jgi:hypothetical protein